MQTTPLAAGDLQGRITSTSGASGIVVPRPFLVGTITSNTLAVGYTTESAPLELSGNIFTAGSARSSVIEGFTGRISTASSGTVEHSGRALEYQGGRITTTARSTAFTTNTIFAGYIGTGATASLLYVSPELQGHIFTATTTIFYLPRIELPAVNIQSTSSLTLAVDMLVVANAWSTSSLAADNLQFNYVFEGHIQTLATAYLTPTVDILSGRITTTTFANIPLLPILPQDEAPYCPIPVVLQEYLDLITSEHQPRPNYISSVTASVEPFVDDQAVVSSLPCLFDLDISVGEQEDFVGQWIGKTRYVHLINVFFTWDSFGLGWDEANWRGPFDPEAAIATLDDYHFRLLLYSAIVVNHWDGSVPNAYRAWDILFADSGYKVLIQDNGNMTMMLGLMGTGRIDAVTQALFQNGEMGLRPEGIELIDYVFQARPGVPFFSWDSLSDSVAGWDIGYWGYLVPPGEGFVPESARMRG
jgi:Protein of unknown function (DUF2612)